MHKTPNILNNILKAIHFQNNAKIAATITGPTISPNNLELLIFML